MAKAKYSHSTKGVYPLSVYKKFPDDALNIPDDIYKQFQDGEIIGFEVVDGLVVAKSQEAINEY